MSEHVLSSEEVDALLKATQEKNQDLSKVMGNVDFSKEGEKHYLYALNNINDIVRSESEKSLMSFLRKKILIQTKSCTNTLAANCVNETAPKAVYSVFRINPNEYYGVFVLEFGFLNQTLNLLYGGKINSKDPQIETVGKVGNIVAEKVSHLLLSSFAQACQEYGQMNCEILRTTSSLNLSSTLGLKPDDPVCLVELAVFFDDLEVTVKMIVSEDFFIDFIPARAAGGRHKEKDFWREAIKTQVVDSWVTVNVIIPDVTMKVKDFMALKEGDTVPISDPTLVYICLNNIKLFRANAGQANNKIVAKIINQI